MPDACAIGVMAGHQGCPGGSAGWADVVVCEPEALGVEFIDVRCLDLRIAVTAKISITLVIGNDDDDIGF